MQKISSPDTLSKFLSDKEVAARLGVSRQTVWRWVREGRFPSPVKIGPAAVRWREAGVMAWEAQLGGAV